MSNPAGPYDKGKVFGLLALMMFMGFVAWSCHDERQRNLREGENLGARTVQNQAVLLGYGKWVVTDGITGTTKFEWVTNPTPAVSLGIGTDKSKTIEATSDM